jgi:polyisoprenoid-binding protein YceI
MSEAPAGTHAFGPQDGQLLLKVFREGVASKMGHDLTIEVKDWSAKADVNPDDMSQTSIEATAQVPSFSVLEGTGGAKPLSRGDKADIKKNIDEKILKGSPGINFRTTGTPDGNGTRFTVTGELTVNGATRRTTVNVDLNGDKARVTFKVVQSEFGIKPFKAFMGALKVRDDVDVELEVPLPTAG